MNALNVGDRAPEFRLPSADGKEHDLADLSKDGPVLLVWIRGTW
jgi:peroxiredoxin